MKKRMQEFKKSSKRSLNWKDSLRLSEKKLEKELARMGASVVRDGLSWSFDIVTNPILVTAIVHAIHEHAGLFPQCPLSVSNPDTSLFVSFAEDDAVFKFTTDTFTIGLEDSPFLRVMFPAIVADSLHLLLDEIGEGNPFSLLRQHGIKIESLFSKEGFSPLVQWPDSLLEKKTARAFEDVLDGESLALYYEVVVEQIVSKWEALTTLFIQKNVNQSDEIRKIQGQLKGLGRQAQMQGYKTLILPRLK